MTLYDEIKERQPALLAAEELILDWTEQCPVLLSEKAHDALAERIAALAAENARLRKALEKIARNDDADGWPHAIAMDVLGIPDDPDDEAESAARTNEDRRDLPAL